MQLFNWFRNTSPLTSRARRPLTTNRVGDGNRHLRHEPLEERQLLTVTPIGDPFLVNQAIGNVDQYLAEPDPFAAIFGGQEESNRSVAVDHDGDFVVTWTDYGNKDGDGAAVFMRMFAPDGTPRTAQIQVNTYFLGDQKNANVAMDADGDFVIVWESEFQDPYDSSSGIFGQRFAANGTAISGEFQVHTSTVGPQVNPEVAIDYDGNFAVTWENQSQYGSFFNDVRVQKFTFDGQRIGSEIRVNDVNIPGFGEANPSIAMDADGDFVVAWPGVDVADDGTLRGGIFARVFAPDTTPYGSAVLVSVGDDMFTEAPFPSVGNGLGHIPKLSSNGVRNAKVSMDSEGNFVVVWESFQDNDLVTDNDIPDSWGTYFRRFHLDPTDPRSVNGVRPGWPADSQVNPTYTANFADPADPDNPIFPTFAGPQINPSVAMDADGDLVIVYNGRGYADYFGYYGFGDDYPSSIGYDDQGVFIRRYHAAAVYDAPDEGGGVPIIFIPGSVHGLPNSVNTDATGKQAHPSVAIEPDGDYIVVWDGFGIGDEQGIFARRYNETEDAAGPYATDVLFGGVRIGEGDELLTPVSQLTVTFDEQVSTFGGEFGFNSVTNPNNWVLLKNGVPVFDGIAGVTFGMNVVSNKWEAVVTVDGNGPLPGTSALIDGTYELVAKNSIRDVPGNPLQSSGLIANGGAFGREFSVQVPVGAEQIVNTTVVGDQLTHRESPQAIASDADGDQIVVWTSIGQDGSGAGVFAQRYAPSGAKLGAEFQVNTLTTGPQQYASVAMDGDGDFVVTWSHYSGDPESVWDVYARRFDAAGDAIDDAEFIVNTETESIQRFSTVAMDIDGDFVVTWQSFEQDGDGYGIYAQRYNSAGERVGGVDEVQSLSILGTATGGSFTLSFDGNIVGPIAFSTELNGVVTAANIEAALAPFAEVAVEAFTNNEFEIVFVGNDANRDQPQITLAANNITGGVTSIDLETPINGVAGEFLVNQTTDNNQVYASVDMDATGVFVITWTSFGQNGDAVFESNILARRFASNDELPSPGALANLGSQPYEPIGENLVSFDDFNDYEDFVLLGTKWLQPGGLGSEVVITYSYSNLFDGGLDELTQAQLTAATEEALALWANYAPLIFVEVADSGPAPDDTDYAADDHPDLRFGYHNIDGASGVLAHAFPPPPVVDGLAGDVHFDDEETWSLVPGVDQIDYLFVAVHEIGHALGLGHETNVTAIMNPVYAEFYSGLGSAFLFPDDISGIQAVYGAIDPSFDGLPLGGEFIVNSTLVNNQMFSDVAVDLDGDFVITFNSYGNDGGGSGYGPGQGGQNGVFARRYNSNAAATGNQFQVNTFIDRNQQYSRVAMDADGDFTVVWESFQDDLDGNGQPDSYGIYAQRFLRNELVGASNGKLGGEFRLNNTIAGQQRFAGVAMDHEGDFTVVWNGQGPGDNQGIFSRRFMISNIDDVAGPVVTDVLIQGEQVLAGEIIEALITDIVVDFGEAVESTPGITNSIRNINNWTLTRDGVPLSGAITSIDETTPNPANPGFNASENKWQWVVSLDSDPEAVGVQPLESGTYTLTIRDRVEDLAGNRLDGNFDGAPGGSYSLTFNVIGFSSGGVGDTPDTPVSSGNGPIVGSDLGNRPVSASDASGDFVIAWTEGTDIVARDYSVAGIPLGNQFTVNTFTSGIQGNPDIAMDDAGNYVVVWQGAGPTEEDPFGIYGQLYDRFSNRVGVQFPVNTFTDSLQSQPSVAMDSDGDFAVTWTSYGQDGDVDGVYMQRYNRFGDPLGVETRVNTNVVSYQSDSDIAMDGNGNYVVTWQSFGQDGSAWGVYGRRFAANGTPQGGEFLVNSTTLDDQRDPAVTMDRDGDFIVTWSSFGQDGSGYGVYGRRFNSAGAPRGSEFRVNTTTLNYQQYPDIASDFAGNFTVTWTSWNQDGDRNGVFARSYNADGSDVINALLGTPLGEIQVNNSFIGDQMFSTIAMDANGDQVIAWMSRPSQVGGADIYFQQLTPGVMTLTGSALADVLTYDAASRTVVFNGVTHPIDSAVGALRFDGGGGNDTVNFIGTSGDETAMLRTGGVEMYGNGFIAIATNVENINVISGGGNDAAVFEGTSAVDQLVVGPGYTELKFAGLSSMATGFAHVEANSNGSLDQALMVDAAGNPWSSSSAHPNVPVLNGTWQSNTASALNGPSNAAFLTGLYVEALGRTPDVSGFDSWLTVLDTGMTREEVAAGFWNSRERASQVVEDRYQSLLGRSSDKRGREYWIDRSMAGMSAEDLTVIFVTSQEYINNNASNSAYVDALYRDILDRNVDSSGHNYWVGQLNNGMARVDFARTVYDSEEMQTKMIDHYYEEFLDRDVDDASLAYYLSFIESGQGDTDDIAVRVLASDEFFANVF